MMMKLRSLFLLLLYLFVLAGCTGMPSIDFPTGAEQPARKQATQDEIREVLELLDEYRRLVTAPVADQQRTYRNALADFESNPGAMQRLRLALLLTLPQVPWHDDTRALQLLGSVAEVQADQSLPRNDLALILHSFVTEQMRQVREEHRKGTEANQRLQAQLAERQRQLQDEQRKVEALEGKLDALRQIDRKVLRRSTER